MSQSASATSGLQVSFLRAVEAVAEALPAEGEHEARQAAVSILSEAMSPTQRAEAGERLAAYEDRRAREPEIWARRAARDQARQERGGVGLTRCRSCGRFKSRPSDVCEFCNEDQVTHNGSRREYDRAVWGQ